MFLFQFVTKIDPEGELAKDKRFAKIDGAYVDVWVHFKDFEGAKALARFYVEQLGWAIEKELHSWEMKKSECSKKDKRFYEEAVKYGYSTVSNMWPKDAPDAHQDYESEEDDESS